MARVFRLARRKGRDHLQVRCSHVAATLLSQPLFQTSLRTADHRQAQQRVAECLGCAAIANLPRGFVAAHRAIASLRVAATTLTSI